MESLLDTLIDYAIYNRAVNAKAVDIFKEFMPDKQKLSYAVSLNEYAGTGNAPFTDVSVRSVQVEVRSENITTARDKCWELYKLFNIDGNMLTYKDRTMIIQSRNTPIKIGVDSKNRYMVAYNMAVTTNND